MERDGEGFEYDDEGRFDYMDYDDDDPDDECALMPNGQCPMAGSEDCDWDCPYSHGPFYAGSEAWHKRHNAGVPLDGCECSKCSAARADQKIQEIAE